MKSPITNKPGRGVLFKVRDKKNENAPDWKGGLNVNGVEYELAAWECISGRGLPYLSVSISPPRDVATTADSGSTADLDRSFGARGVR